MNGKRMIHWFVLFMCLVSFTLTPASPGLASQPAAVTETPDGLYVGDLSSYLVAYPAVYYYTGTPACPPRGPQEEETASLAAPDAFAEIIGRIPAYGGLARQLYNRSANCNSNDVISNLVSDGSYLYWMSSTQGGLVRLPVSASPGQTPELITNAVSGQASLDMSYSHIYILKSGVSGLYAVNRADLSFQTVINQACTSCGSLEVTLDNYYWKDGGSLIRWNIDENKSYVVNTGVSDYYVTDYTVWYAKGNAVNLYIWWVNPAQDRPIYYSPDPGGNVYDLTVTANHLFVLETRPLNCYPFACYNYVLVRDRWDGEGPSEEVYATNVPFPFNLSEGGGFVFWQESGVINRLPELAAALPKINLRPTNIEVTQAIQNSSNGVRLIAGKRTFARVTVNATGAAVPGVTAYLYRTDQNGVINAGPLVPVNPVGKLITVPTNPVRTDLNQSFLFELPWDWITPGNLYLRAWVNPNKIPLEPDYNDNFLNAGPLNFANSPRLPVQFVSFGYTLNNTTYYPRLKNDVVLTYSYIRRTYPVSSAPGFIGDPSPGFRPNLWLVVDDGLGSRVNQSASECSGVGNLCASAYVNGLMRTMRTQEGLDDSIFMYGMISDGAGFFPRGQEGGSSVSSGPMGTPNTAAGNFLGGGWDNDPTYGDWYAAHEIGHSMGRAHPVPASDDPKTSTTSEGCGHSRTDSGYPYPNAEISPAGGALAGFDTGDWEFGLGPRVIAGNTGHDIMSYCNEQWVSDYTYNAIYDRLTAPARSPQAADLAYGVYQRGPRLAGDYLSLSGFLLPDTNDGAIQHLQRLTSLASLPPLTPGDYSIRLVNSGGVLSENPFTPEAVEDAAVTFLTFSETIDFIPGATAVQVVRQSDGVVLASQAISPNPPSVSNVALQNAPNPVSGTVTLTWQASDPDGGALTYDVYYSRDNGTTFQPLRLNLSATSLDLDTSRLAGSQTALFRVVANDGANTGYAHSAPFVMAAKAPIPRIVLPQDNLHVQWGQLVNLSGEAEDFQDGAITTGLTWSSASGILGTGPLLSLTNLPVGANQITLTAVNSLGLTASTSITVVVEDNLNLPGPVLSVAPGAVNWQVEAGTIVPQQASLSISNAGGGGLTWTASSGASWLTLDVAAGTAPGQILLTADPAGIPEKSTVQTELVIQSPEAGQTITIPVSLAVGAVYNFEGPGPGPAPGPGSGKTLFLPMLMRP